MKITIGIIVGVGLIIGIKVIFFRNKSWAEFLGKLVDLILDD